MIEEIEKETKEKERKAEENEENEKTSADKLDLKSKAYNSFSKSQSYGKDRITYSMMKDLFMLLVDIISCVCGFHPFFYDWSKSVAVSGGMWDV